MDSQSGSLAIFVIVLAWLGWTDGLQHRIGDSIWSIPPHTDFYTNWSTTQYFQIGDTLVFEFQSEFHNVMQVSRREYEGCTADNPFQSFWVGPATVPLIEEGVYYFICSVANYCILGQKISITVHQPSSTPSPSPSPPLSLLPVSPSLDPALPSGPPPVGTFGRPETPTTGISGGVVPWPVVVDYPSEIDPAGLESSGSLLSTRSSGDCSMGGVLCRVSLTRVVVFVVLVLYL